MINSKDYYNAPIDEIFDDIKQSCIKVWQTYDDTYKYATEKVDRIKDLKNVSDNYAYIISMFDIHNQQKVLHLLERKDSIALVYKLIN